MPDAPPDPARFSAALGDRSARAALGIQLSDADAALLVHRSDWAETYYRQWCGEPVVAERGAPVALPRAVALAPALPLPVADPVVVDAVPVRSSRAGHPVRAGIVAATVGSVLAASLILAATPQRTADAAVGSGTHSSDPFPAGLDADAAPTSSPDPTASVAPRDRLGADITAALRLDERTAAAPAVSGIVAKEVAHIADVACLGGYDPAIAARIAQSVAQQPDLDAAAGDAVADSIARYCAATTG